MIYVIGQAPFHLEYQPADMPQFLKWFEKQSRYQLDVETNVTDYMRERKLRTVQFGEYNPSVREKTQYVIIWTDLTNAEKIQVLTVLNDGTKKKYIHNSYFEYQTFLNYGLVLENTYDTLITEKVLYTGYNNYNDEEGNRFFSLAATAIRRLNLYFNKELQSEFDHDIELTPEHIFYAAQDVQYLDVIAAQQEEETKLYHLEAIADLENEVALAFADIEYNGMKMDQEAWLHNLTYVEPIIKEARSELENHIHNDARLYKRALERGIISNEDVVEINWNSPAQKKLLLQEAFPSLQGSTKAILRKFLGDPERTLEEVELLYPIVNDGNYEPLFKYLLLFKREFLIENDFLIPAGTIRINWNSVEQVLPLLTAIHPKLTGLDEQKLSAVSHPIVSSYDKYKSALKLASSYGEKFITKNIHPDGKVRTRFNQILETGRVSSAKPKSYWALTA